MKFTVAAAALFAGVASAGYANVTTVTIPCDVTTTEVVTAYTTYCPESTEIVHGTKTYTVTAPGTVTITSCPEDACTRTKTYTTVTVTTCPVVSGTPVLPSTVTPITSAPATQAPPAKNETKTTTVCEECVKPTGNVTVPTTTVQQGGAAKVGLSGAVAGAIAAAVYFL